MAVADGPPIRVVLALHADDLNDFLFHQLGEQAEPDGYRQGQQPLSRTRSKLAERLLDANRQLLLGRGLRDQWDRLSRRSPASTRR
jgi:hypothetical protein